MRSGRTMGSVFVVVFPGSRHAGPGANSFEAETHMSLKGRKFPTSSSRVFQGYFVQ